MRFRRARRGNPSPGNSHDRWLVSYADFVTLLLAFFVTMYAITRLDSEKLHLAQESINRALSAPVFLGGFPVDAGLDKTTAPGLSGDLVGATLVHAPPSSQIEEVTKTVRGALKEQLEKEEVRLLHNERGLVLRLPEFLLFDSGQANLRPEAMPMLNKLADILKLIPNQLVIEGHTDNRPIHTPQFPSNWELSTARAAALVRYLVEEHHLDPARLGAAGYGEYRTVADNNDEKGRQANRRVELIIRPVEKSIMPGLATGR
ncbi:MAG: OmpA family protein [Deltaproteobacteria bacterium]|nr:OmpA family protein [Deltaproteobacteria bacterium]MBI4796577.1 OmpA family protein [Deltaproteobacteria bacterium]